MTADRARGALAVLQDADGKFLCEVPCGYIVEPTASAYQKKENVRLRRSGRSLFLLHSCKRSYSILKL